MSWAYGKAILPRKAVLELSRLLQDGEDLAEVALGDNNIRCPPVASPSPQN